MIENALVYVHSASGGKDFAGCGATVEGNFIVTCRHVWRDAGGEGAPDGEVEAVFPRLKRDGKSVRCTAKLIDPCEDPDGDSPDLVLLRTTGPPLGAMALQVARAEKYETGNGFSHARLPSRNTDVKIEGKITDFIGANNMRSFNDTAAARHWFEKGSSGSPVFVGGGQQLAGIVSLSELGPGPQKAELREAFVVPGTTIWRFVETAIRKEFDEEKQAIERVLNAESKSDGFGRETEARDLIFEIARRSTNTEQTNLEQALADARSLFERGLKAIEAGQRGSNLGDLVDNLLKRLADHTRLGDFESGAADAERTFAEWERVEAERSAESHAVGLRILEAGVEQDLLRRDPASAAKRIARIVALEHGEEPTGTFDALRARQDEWYARGRDKGLNLDLAVSIEIARRSCDAAVGPDQKGTALNDLGNALSTLGERESGTARLEQAVAAYRAALEEWTRERVPLDWAMTQNNLGTALATLGERESGTARLEEAVAAYRAALEERTRERVPLDWAMTQNNLGTALSTLGERESGTARLEQAVAAYRLALEEWTRERVPLQWAMTQNNLGTALSTLGERESGTARLEQAVAAYRAALEEWTRERVPLDWAMTQNNLGTALATLGERESGTARLEEAVAAYRAALEERTRERVPLDWAMTQNNLGTALGTLGGRESGTARLEEAVAAYRAALEERTRERVPLQWAQTQNNLGNALGTLGERESGTARLEQAVAAYRAALEEWTRERVPLDWAGTQNNLGTALGTLGERESGTARLEEEVAAYRAALEERTRERVPLQWAQTQNNLDEALRTLAERSPPKKKPPSKPRRKK